MRTADLPAPALLAVLLISAAGSTLMAVCTENAPIRQGGLLERPAGFLILADPTADVGGFMWQLGEGDPADGAGVDLDSTRSGFPVGPGDAIWIRRSVGAAGTASIDWNWLNSGSDGCLPGGIGSGTLVAYVLDNAPAGVSYVLMAVDGVDTPLPSHDLDTVLSGIGPNGNDAPLRALALPPVVSNVSIMDASTLSADVAPPLTAVHCFDDQGGTGACADPLLLEDATAGLVHRDPGGGGETPVPGCEDGCAGALIPRGKEICWNGEVLVLANRDPAPAVCAGGSGDGGLCDPSDPGDPCVTGGGTCEPGQPSPTPFGPPIPGACIRPDDLDGDGFPIPDDCDDDNPDVFPGAPEVCDGVNNDCDDPAWPAPAPIEDDADGDGFDECAGDCNDDEPAQFPGNPEICDRLDNDCDGVLPAGETDGDGDGVTGCEGDCDDGDPTRFAGNPEICDGIDNDCDAAVDGPTVCAVGDRVWQDLDGNGIQDGGEPGLAGIVVMIFDDSFTWVKTVVTDSTGLYRANGLIHGQGYFAKFFLPSTGGFAFSPADAGSDDGLDSDADPFTGQTPIFALAEPDGTSWDAGMVPEPGCVAPDEPVYLFQMTVSDDGNAFPILHFMDPNQPDQVTGYNIYRTSDPSVPENTWPLVASDVIDMDDATPNKQWVDTSGDVSPSGLWFYDVAAYNNLCPAEGPR